MLKKASRGFTLIELLVVISIVALLATVGLAAANSAQTKARNAKALTSVKAIENAINAFYNKYQNLPVEEAGENDTTIKTDNAKFLKILIGKETGDQPLNRNMERFLEVPETTGAKDGLIYDKTTNEVVKLLDFWGNPYQVLVDTDYNDEIRIQGRTLNGRRVAVFSCGADKKPDTKDDVVSW